MNIEYAAAGENFIKVIIFELVVTGSAAYDHGFDIQIVQGIGYTMEQYAVVHGDFIAFVFITAGGLRIAAAQIARW